MQRALSSLVGRASSAPRLRDWTPASGAACAGAAAVVAAAAAGAAGLVATAAAGGAATNGLRALSKSMRSTIPTGRTLRCMQSALKAPAGMASKSCWVKDGRGGGGGGSAAAAGGFNASLSRLLLLLLLLLLPELLWSRRRRRRPRLLPLLALLEPRRPRRFLERRPLGLRARTGLLDLLLLGLGLRSQSPTAQRSNPWEKLGPPSKSAARMRNLRLLSAFRIASTSPVFSCRAATSSASSASRSMAFLRKTCLCEGQGSMAISTAEAVASSRSALGVSCNARRIISRMKKPQSCAVSCCGTPGRQTVSSTRVTPLESSTSLAAQGGRPTAVSRSFAR
mmetsp:Transcript_93126/g.259394  ORF Transcript_93126/g.259394 Transcript_93126/m.259394 type:complete len:338 (-) Transcript_93126:1010-2023(-)